MSTEDPNLIKNIAKRYFEDLFVNHDGHYASVVHALAPCVSNEDNVVLTRPFSRVEFFKVLSQMGDDKSPGPDGAESCFL